MRAMIFLIMIFFSHQALAASCALTEAVRHSLAWRSGEAPMLQAVMNNGQLMELYRNHDGTTWSVVLTAMKNGQKISCIVATGSDLTPVIWHLQKQKT